MAKCRVCKTNIPDGEVYCYDCKEKEQLISNESYLDSLLNSVKNTEPTVDSIYRKKNQTSIDETKDSSIEEEETQFFKEIDMSDFDASSAYSIDMDDIKDFDLHSETEADYEGDEDLDGTSFKDVDDNIISNDLMDIEDNYIYGDEDLYGDDLTKLLSMEDNLDTDVEIAESLKYDNIPPANNNNEEKQLDIENINNKYDSSMISETAAALDLNPERLNEEEQMKNIDQIDFNSDATDDEKEYTPYDMKDFGEDDIDTDLNDLLNNLDHMEEMSSEEEASDDYNILNQEVFSSDTDLFESNEVEDEDLLSLFNQISPDESATDDSVNFNSILGGGTMEDNDNSKVPTDVGEVFSDALTAVTSLSDNDKEEAELLSDIFNSEEENTKKRKGFRRKKERTIEEKTDKEALDKPKTSLWKRLFGNVKDENSKTEKPKLSEEESTPAPKKAKKSKPTKGKKAATKNANEDDSQNKKENKKSKKLAKKEKKEQLKKEKEVNQIIDEIEEDEGRINRVGAAIVFSFFVLLALFMYLGTNIASYHLNIQKATKYFDDRKYTEAYNEVCGMDLKDKDVELYDKIMTVMFVNKQLNSFNNYYTLGLYPEALDSLLKGLKKYDKYIELATMLGIEYDMDYVREKIIAELDNVFHISEKEAQQINALSNKTEYSSEVYDIVSKNMNN